jgi:hypothetical protein
MGCMLLPSQISERQQDLLDPSAIVLCILYWGICLTGSDYHNPWFLRRYWNLGLKGWWWKEMGASPNTALFAAGVRSNKIRFLRGSAPQVIRPMFQFISWLYTKWWQVQCSDCCNTVRWVSRYVRGLRYGVLVVSVEADVAVCCCFTVFSC